jgi:hypothetical protein
MPEFTNNSEENDKSRYIIRYIIVDSTGYFWLRVKGIIQL